MQSVTPALLNFVCATRLEKDVAQLIHQAGETRREPRSLLTHINALMKENTGCSAFSTYETVSKCHVMCLACMPENHKAWLMAIVYQFENLMQTWQSGNNDHSLTAYEMGSLIGLFRGGFWLQQRKQQFLDSSLFSNMAIYIVSSIGRPRMPINESSDSGNNLAEALICLDRALKEYIRPKDKDLARQLEMQLQFMFIDLQARLRESPLIHSLDRLSGPAGCIFNGLVHGVININGRSTLELMPAAITLLS